MKKIIFWLFLGFTLAGCTTVVSDLEMETIDVYVDASDWKYTNYTDGNSPFANNYFYATVEVPEISRAVFTDGEVKAYVVRSYCLMALGIIIPRRSIACMVQVG